MAAIVADLDEHRHPFHVAIENWQHDMNIGSIVRSANAFGAAEVHIIGKRRWNRRGAMVTDRYQHVRHHEDIAAFTAWAEDAEIPVIAVDNVDGSVPVDRAELPQRCVLLFGQEGPGCPPRRSPRHPPSSRSPSTARPARSTRARRPRS
jgi:tRNA G18 (ribose-2'-O)-methylase SpoU